MTPSLRRTAIEGLAYLLVAGLLATHWWYLGEHLLDVPRADDWRMLRAGPQLLTRELDLSWLFFPKNSTVFATGKFFDYLFFIYGPGDHALYKQISIVAVLAPCLLLIWRMLKKLDLPLQWQLLGILSTA